MPSTNFHNLARVRESAIGVTPGSPRMQNCFITSDSLKIARQFVKSQTITGNRGTKEHLPVGIAVEGGGAFEAAFGYWDWFLELINFDSFAALEEAYNETADSNITDIDHTTQTVSAAGEWVEGMLVEIIDPDIPANNVRFAAQAGTGSGTIIAPGGTFSASTAAPGAGVSVYCYGVEFPSGDISATATGLASASNAFANYPLLADMGCKIGGQAASTRFDTSALNDYTAIESIASDGSAITLTELPTGWTTDGGGGKTIQIMFGDDSRTGEDVLTDTLQRRNKKSSPVFGQSLLGVAGQTLTLEFAQQAIVTGQGTIIGTTGALLTSLLDASPEDPLIGVGNVMKTGSNIARLTEGGAAIAAAVGCQSLSLQFNNNITPVGELASEGAIDLNPGDFDLIVQGVYRAGTKDLLEKYLTPDGAETKQMIVVRRGQYAYQLRIPRATVTDYEDPVQDRNQEWTSNVRIEQKIDPTTGGLFVCTRYRRWQ